MHKRPVWFEGMTLDPHHFQQWDRHQKYVLDRRVRACTPYGWGLTDLDIDHERLRGGEFVVTACRGILPDGLPIDMPDTHPLPPPQKIRDAFDPSQESLPVFLAVPRPSRRGSNVAMHTGERSADARFVSDCIQVADDNTGSNERRIEVAYPNAGIHIGTVDEAQYISMQITEIQRASGGTYGGTYECAASFIPPCLRTSASERLQALLRSLMDKLIAKSRAFQERRDNVLSQRDISPTDTAALGLLAAINISLPVVHHHFRSKESHPEQVYLTLCQLAGHLAAFVPSASHPNDMPSYNHANLSSTFDPLTNLLEALLRDALPRTHHRRVSLETTRENVLTAALSAAEIDAEELFLVVRSETMPEGEVVRQLPEMLRIASPNTIDTVLNSYTRALTIDHTTRLPPGVPIDGHATYFRVQKRGRFWKAVEDSGHIAVFAPARTDDLDMHLLTVFDPS